MNTHIIHGRLVRDPEYTAHATDESKDRTKFTVAVDRSFGDEADFIDCIVFGKRAKVIDKFYHKGKEILVQGEGRTGSYTDKNGVKRKTYTIVVGQFDFCGSRDSASDQTVAKMEAEAKSILMPDSMQEQEEDIPF